MIGQAKCSLFAGGRYIEGWEMRHFSKKISQVGDLIQKMVLAITNANCPPSMFSKRYHKLPSEQSMNQ